MFWFLLMKNTNFYKTFAKLQDQPFSFFDRSSVGWLMARVSSDTSRLGEIISWGLVDIVYAVFKLLFIFIVMWNIDFKLSLILKTIVVWAIINHQVYFITLFFLFHYFYNII